MTLPSLGLAMIVDPKWTFAEALDAAWTRYRGGQQFGAPNRIKMLQQWGNVVGRDRAVAELSSVLAEHATLAKAAEAFGFSQYALREVRRAFQAMPRLTPHVAPPSTLDEFLRSLSGVPSESEIGFMTRALPRLAAVLGYAESEVYYEVTLPGTGRRGRVDAVFAPGGPSEPRVLVEVTAPDLSAADKKYAVDTLRLTVSDAGAAAGLLLSAQLFTVVDGQRTVDVAPDRVTKEESAELVTLLGRSNAPTATKKVAVAYEAGARRLQSLLAGVAAARTNDEKRASLESLAAEAFAVHRSIRAKFRNLRTRSSEIDIVCEIVAGSTFEFLREHGRYFLVECKNWTKPAGAKEIRDFIGKLRKCRIRVGLYFSRNGITGEQHGTDAVREIHSAFDADGTMVVVLAERDLAGIAELQQVMGLLEEKMDALRFDF
jgi:hypothetical protein